MGLEQIVDLGQKHALRKNVGVTIAEDGLKLFDGCSAPQMPAAKPVKQTGRCSKLSGNFSMSIKYFSTPGTLPLYSGVMTCRPDDCRTALEKGSNDLGFSAYDEEEKISDGSCARSSTRKGTFNPV